MKFAMNFLSLLFSVLILTNTAYAESPREQLRQMVEQLQTNPNDDALREQIIKLAQELKPGPAVPEEADRRMARGTAAFKGAKSVADYRDAAKEFEQATQAAPWYGDAYLNLGVTQDKAENYEAALRSLKLALLASPNDKEIKALIYEVEYRKEKWQQEQLAQSEYISGHWKFQGGNAFDEASHSEFHMEGDVLIQDTVMDQSIDSFKAGQNINHSRWSRVKDRSFQHKDARGYPLIIEFDGDTIIQSYSDGSKAYYKKER